VEYAFHYHFNGKLESTKQRKAEIMAEWLLETADFSAVPGRGVQCSLNDKIVLVCPIYATLSSCVFVSFGVTVFVYLSANVYLVPK
jgi:hypothetical protein